MEAVPGGAGRSVLSLSVWAQDKDFARIQLSATKIAPNLYTLSGPQVSIQLTRTPRAAGSECLPALTASS